MPKKKKRENTEPAKKKSRAVFSCPPKVEALLNTLRLVLPLLRLPDIEELGNGFAAFFSTLPDDFTEKIKSSSAAYVDKANVFSPQDDDYGKAILANEKWEYQKFIILRQDVRAIVDATTLARKNGLDIDESIHLPYLVSQVERKVSADGIYTVQLSGLDEILNGVNLTRLRSCEICSHIFWAKREESETCLKKCFDRLRVYRSRNLTPEEKAERKAKREANKRFKAKPKSIRSKNNGTV